MAKKPKTLTEEQLAKLKKNAAYILAEARMNFAVAFPFIGNVSMALDLIPTRDEDNPTASTDGKAIYFDIDFLSRLSSTEIQLVLGHEVYHNVMMHSLRKESRDHQLFNIATDIEVNQLLQKDGFTIPNDMFMPSTFGLPCDLSAEDYYDRLLKNMPKMQINDGNGNGDEGESNGSSSSSASGNGGKPKRGIPGGQFDKHIFDPSSFDDGSNGKHKQRVDQYGEVGKDKDFAPKPEPKNFERISEVIVAAAQQIEREKGELPAHIASMVKKLVEPELNWKDMLAQYITKCSANDPTWSKPNRRFVWSGVFLPGHEGHHLKVAVGLDTSGSTCADMDKFLSELQAMASNFQSYSIDLIQCDAEIQRVDHYDESMPLTITDDFKFCGGGGTKLHPVFDYISVNDLDPDVIVMFTDGYIDSIPPETANGKPTLWILTNDGSKSAINFGDVVKFKA